MGSSWFGRAYTAAFEPFTSYPNSHERATDAGAAPQLEPGGSASATVRALIYEGLSMVLSAEPYITLNGAYPFWEAEEKFGLEDVVPVTEDGVEILTSEEAIAHDHWVG